jgi:hypothetical protein
MNITSSIILLLIIPNAMIMCIILWLPKELETVKSILLIPQLTIMLIQTYCLYHTFNRNH